MKQVMTFTSFFFFLLIIACKKSLTTQNTFTGKWKLVQTLSDPGDGSGQWQTAVAGTNEFIQFNEDSSVQSNWYPEFKKYSITDSIRVKFIRSDGTFSVVRYKFSPLLLEINPPCIERCGARFVRE